MIFISPPDVQGVANSCLYAVGEICIFIPLNKKEMRSRAPRFLLCDRNHIIDWHTESCPSNPPRREPGLLLMKTKAGLRQLGRWAKTVSLPRSPVLFVSALFSPPRRRETMASRTAARNTKQEDNSLFPSTADVIFVPLNCCIPCRSNLQSHCVSHAPWHLCVRRWQALMLKPQKKKKNPTLHGICTGLIEFYPQRMKHSIIFLSCCFCAYAFL